MLLSERGRMTCSCGWTMLLSKMKQLGETNFDTLVFPPFVKNILSMKQLGESNSGTIQFSNYVTVSGVELVVTHQTSGLKA